LLTALPGLDLSGLFYSFDITSRGSVIAAVSGGSDSTALLLLLNDYLSRQAPQTRLVAVTVDHALRTESAGEAAAVARLCESLGIAHRTVVWSGAKPETGIAAAAREARHALLAEAARAERSDLVFTGHTANDQAETVMMRGARGKGSGLGRGMAGIAPATLFGGNVWFGRPLLDIRREALRALLKQRGVGWMDDPSNVSDRYERPRVRKALSESETDQALKIAGEASAERTALGEDAARLIGEHAHRAGPGLLRLSADFFRGDLKDAAVYALRILLAVVGGTEHLPDQARTAGLYTRLASGEPVRAVLSRALIDRRRGGIFLLREQRGLPASENLQDGAVWDGRYRIVRNAEAVLSRAASPAKETNEFDAPASLVRQAAAGLPDAGPGRVAVPVAAPWTRYLPLFDFAPARAIARLIGASEIPEPPFPGHIAGKA
jgi:tRNA(Ile)-lysidine synthase